MLNLLYRMRCVKNYSKFKLDGVGHGIETASKASNPGPLIRIHTRCSCHLRALLPSWFPSPLIPSCAPPLARFDSFWEKNRTRGLLSAFPLFCLFPQNWEENKKKKGKKFEISLSLMLSERFETKSPISCFFLKKIGIKF